MSTFISAEDGYYSLTTAGSVLFIAIGCILLILAALITHFGKNDPASESTDSKATQPVQAKKEGTAFTPKRLVFAGVCLALAFLLSFVKLVHLPWGGSITLCSMLFISLIGYFYGPKVGFTAAFTYSILQLVQGGGSYMLSPLQVCMDYLFAFTALGISGCFRKSKNGLIVGYLAGILLRGLFHSIGGYLYWMEYMPEDFPQSLASIYPIVYNYAYILGEAVITVILISLPPVKKAIQTVRSMAE